jgi:hypothetical protein
MRHLICCLVLLTACAATEVGAPEAYRSFALEHAVAGELAARLAALFSEDDPDAPRVIADARTNSLLIAGGAALQNPEVLEMLDALGD